MNKRAKKIKSKNKRRNGFLIILFSIVYNVKHIQFIYIKKKLLLLLEINIYINSKSNIRTENEQHFIRIHCMILWPVYFILSFCGNWNVTILSLIFFSCYSFYIYFIGLLWVQKKRTFVFRENILWAQYLENNCIRILS